MNIPAIERQPSTSKLVRAYRQEQDVTLMEVRKDFYGVVGLRLGVLRIAEGKNGEMVALIDSVETTGLENPGSIIGDSHAK
jgi:hypothetical protein